MGLLGMVNYWQNNPTSCTGKTMELLRQENSIFWGAKNIKSHAKNSSDAEHLFAQGTTCAKKTQKNQKKSPTKKVKPELY